MSGKHFIQFGSIAFAAVAAPENAAHLAGIRKREAQCAHPFGKLLFVERKEHRECVDFRLLAITHLLILICTHATLLFSAVLTASGVTRHSSG